MARPDCDQKQPKPKECSQQTYGNQKKNGHTEIKVYVLKFLTYCSYIWITGKIRIRTALSNEKSITYSKKSTCFSNRNPEMQ